MNRVSEAAQAATHDGPQPMEGDQLLGLMPDQRRPRDPRDYRERYEPPHQQSYPPQDQYPQQEQYSPQEHWDESMAAHPLFRGLLAELPTRSDPPSPEFLETWIQTARSILELLYRPGGSRH